MSLIQRIFSIELPSLVPLQLPSRMETHLWYVVPDEVKSISLLKHYSQILSPSENDKVLQMRGNKLQKNALLARTLVRTTIARYQTNNVVDPRTLIFKKNMYGKPEVDWQSYKNCDSPPLHFNISHTDSLISCGVTVHVPFTTIVVKFLSAIPDPEVQRKEFIKLWTLKEAYVKALGKGFSGAPFNTFTIQSKAGTNGGYNLCKVLLSNAISCCIVHFTSEMSVDSQEKTKKCNGEWKFALLELADSHYAAICIEDDQASGGAVTVDIGPMRCISCKRNIKAYNLSTKFVTLGKSPVILSRAEPIISNEDGEKGNVYQFGVILLQLITAGERFERYTISIEQLSRSSYTIQVQQKMEAKQWES
ncbi:unnamed protein product [Arabidopsis thaliana]|uniref:holo-[acyl-carrier-protein] synthase n=1 Tax=Arabidopsis thaliana TaxID=3702 RepID=A0A5S9WWT3_ARATH|nr:unnamed protein product [Arabidopsis thaliana]